MYSNTEGNSSAAFGFQALYSNTEGAGNTATGYLSLHKNTLGSFNTANGYKALGTGSGNANTAVGYESLLNSNGHANTAVGYQTLLNNGMGEYNTAIGIQALNANTGSRNTAIGANALRVSALAVDNTAVGYDALKSNTTGSVNVGLGSKALNSNTTGEMNTALGVAAAVLNTTGNQNTAVGFLTLTQNSTGSYNTASGHAALQTATGNGNTAMGMAALLNNNAGDYNTAIGYRANVPDQLIPIVNATALGAHTIVDASNKVRIGNAAVTVIEGQVPFTTPSDGRFKFKIQDDVKGLDFILQLKPVTYQFDVKRFDNQYEQKEGQVIPASNIIQTSYDEAARIRRSGFIAQEVEQAANASGYNFSGIIKPRTEQDHYSLSYDAFVVPLVKAVQEQQKIIEKLQEINTNEQSRISRLEKQVEELLRQLKASK
ncbi:tail fiber domain-containing protein [Paraflavitalea speifideaquila]|uniref:tail fiber domain-containing protein n=1 Tax=Paraflavitalea speifideaquila TaxID=3076558 RepID=UPI0028E57C82|nr:tail fiber domain-containing protein [Paraflavitalea speifideiaquila]